MDANHPFDTQPATNAIDRRGGIDQIQQQVKPQFQFGLPSPPWMA
jgi:hypothetical protein